ncbi:GerMN domain-containing protein [Streptomyces fradiae]|uniref:GerMN domain-containing protein n=1 Tax=Streptomyces fradiae TaxID=1906 RepID=UPI0020190261|nr:Gmad2 immunoglobulin-like domain-containing protein [Streptomyces fradiae]UQS30128.1 GerMN domain-containing protein [Streptomyces fradiae]
MAFRTRTTSARPRTAPARPRCSRKAPLASALALALALSACAAGTGGGGAGAADRTPRTGSAAPQDPAATPAAPSASGTRSPGGTAPPPTAPAPGPTTPPAEGRQVRTGVYFLHGERVSPAPRSVTAPATVAGALRALMAGPNPRERGHGRTTAIPEGTRLRSLAVRDGVATVDLTGRYDDGGGTLSMRARLAQVVFTATRFPAVTSVRFALDGGPVTRFGGEGVDLARPVGRADFEDLTPAVLVESPMIGDTVRGPVRVWGTANTFEASFGLRITDADGHTAAHTPVMATSGNGVRGTFDLTVRLQGFREGPGTLTALWDDPEQERLVSEATVPLTLRR